MFPSKEAFHKKVEDNARGAVAWKTLDLFVVYRIDEMKIVNTRFGESPILKMTMNDDSRVHVWAPKGLKCMLETKKLPCYVMPTGEKVCEGNIERVYQTFEMLNAAELL